MKKSELKSIIKEVILNERKLIKDIDFVNTYISETRSSLDEMEEEFNDLKMIHDSSGQISTKLIKDLIDKYCNQILISSQKITEKVKSIEKSDI